MAFASAAVAFRKRMLAVVLANHLRSGIQRHWTPFAPQSECRPLLRRSPTPPLTEADALAFGCRVLGRRKRAAPFQAFRSLLRCRCQRVALRSSEGLSRIEIPR